MRLHPEIQIDLRDFTLATGDRTSGIDLRDHHCLVFRNALESAMDLWEFERGDERESVIVRGQLVAGNAHVFASDELGRAGLGVFRTGELGNAAAIASGEVMPVLHDWQPTFRPPVSLLYRPSVRRVPRVRRFIDFVEELFRMLEASRTSLVTPGAKPAWTKRRYRRTSESRQGGANRK